MLKGVTKRIIEINSPSSEYFERAVLYLKTDRPYPKRRAAIELAEEYLKTVEPEEPAPRIRKIPPATAALALGLAVSLAALAVVLILFTKI